jgi:hypothetical protein
MAVKQSRASFSYEKIVICPKAAPKQGVWVGSVLVEFHNDPALDPGCGSALGSGDVDETTETPKPGLRLSGRRSQRPSKGC